MKQDDDISGRSNRTHPSQTTPTNDHSDGKPGSDGAEPACDSQGPATLFHDLYGDLKRLAAYFMVGQSPNHTLAPTALLNEAYLKLSDRDQGRWNSKAHFMAEAAKTMRSVLVDHARAKGRGKRKAPGHQVPLEGILERAQDRVVDIVELDKAIRKLDRQGENGRLLAQVADLIIIAGMRIGEIALVLQTSTRTIERRWKMARAWLRSELSDDAA